MHSIEGKDIVCFSHDWTGDPLSKTHIVRILARKNRVLWVNSLANRKPTASSKDLSRVFKKLNSFFFERLSAVEKNIFVMNPIAFPAYGSSAVREFNRRFLLAQLKKAFRSLNFSKPIILIFNPAAGLIVENFKESFVVYYCVDEYTAFTGAAVGLGEIEENLCRKADLVIVSAEKLFESKSKFNDRTFLIRHGVDWSHFRHATEPIEPASEIKDLPRPIIGFHGLLADWIDFELIEKIANHFREGSVVLIGKTTIEAESSVNELRKLKNVYLLGRKPYAQLPSFCRGFDVAINPFIINELTLAANPLKVREYLAAGLQVVSTDIPEVRHLKYCFVAENHDDFIKKLELSLANAPLRTEISDSIREESWEAKVAELEKLICEFGG